jgi:hypothetical protein
MLYCTLLCDFATMAGDGRNESMTTDFEPLLTNASRKQNAAKHEMQPTGRARSWVSSLLAAFPVQSWSRVTRCRMFILRAASAKQIAPKRWSTSGVSRAAVRDLSPFAAKFCFPVMNQYHL